MITSSPAPIPAMRKAISMVQVPELNVRTGRPPKYSDSWASKAWTLGPLVIQPERRTSPTAAIVASSMTGLENGRKGCWLMAIWGPEWRTWVMRCTEWLRLAEDTIPCAQGSYAARTELNRR
ncbi:hypothetical protein D3C81_1912340 [compost metagenome]